MQNYWNDHYAKNSGPTLIPTQFAAFIANEFTSAVILEIGCGSGRDSLFFARLGLSITGVDKSPEAIQLCEAASRGLHKQPKFLCAGIDEHDKILSASPKPTLIYARFFLHAVDEDSEVNFFGLAKYVPHIAVEFRTLRDRALPKETEQHYRRYISPAALISRASEAGFDCPYFVEGFGYAKHGGDDAHIARCIFERRR